MRTSCLVCYDIADDKRLKKVFKAMRSLDSVAQGSLYNPAALRDLLSFSQVWRGPENARLEPAAMT
jgi:CRISPR/Cas system-associated endoribonuclease Cas2